MSEEASDRRADASAELRTAVVVVVEEPGLYAIARERDRVLAELGLPLHVTLLFPFAPAAELDTALPLLAAVIAHHERFAFRLGELRTFRRTVWIAPEPAAPFVALTEAIQAAFPRYPPFGGQFEEVVPHLTLADGVAERELGPTVARLRTLVEPILPVKVTAEEATVLAEQLSGRWSAVARLPPGTTG
jgi:2'-5' RNA ligase